MEKLKVAVVGAGIYGQNHLNAYTWNTNADLVAVCDMNPEITKKVAKEYNVDTFNDIETMLNEVDVDVVSIATPDPYHKDPALAAIRHGKHILVEKPLATTSEDAYEIIKAAEEAGVRVMVDYHMFDAVIFDMDGLLFDTEKVFNLSWQELASMYKKDLPQVMLDELRGTSGNKMDSIIERYWSIPNGESVRKKLFEISFKKLQKHVPIKDGAKELLDYLKSQGYPMAIASSSPKNLIMNNLKTTHFLNYFDVIVSGEEVKRGKPSPDIFLLAAKKLKMETNKCLVLEDGIHGVLAGYKAGSTVFMVPDLVQPSEDITKKKIPVYQSLFDVLTSIKDKKGTR